ncbi:hypothetical protein T484DRAFT_2317990, partial [Baffinella frigidus]
RVVGHYPDRDEWWGGGARERDKNTARCQHNATYMHPSRFRGLVYAIFKSDHSIDVSVQDNMAGYKESDNMCPLTFKEGIAMLLCAITSAASAAVVLAFLAGDTAATACVFFGAVLGALKCYDLKGLAIVGSVLVTASAVCFVRDSSGMVLEIYPHAWTKALFPTAVDWTTTRNGFLITVLHSANPLMCYIQNNAMLVSINVVTFIGAYNGHGTIAADSCLMEASRTVTTYVPPVYENFMQVIWGTYNPTYISMQGMLLNEVTGCIDRVCIATFMGFFVGVLVRAQGKRAAFNTDFLGKRWMFSFLCCRVSSLTVVAFMSLFQLDTRSAMFKAGVTTDFLQTCLLVFSDPTVWHIVFRMIEFAHPLSYDSLNAVVSPGETATNVRTKAAFDKKQAAFDAKQAADLRRRQEKEYRDELAAAKNILKYRLRSQMKACNPKSRGT